MRILVVDDSIVFRSAIKQALSKGSMFSEIQSASNGKIAISLLKESSFDAVTLDVEMPVMYGIETLKEIRKFNKDIIVIFFSSQTLKSASKTLDALALGANDFVRKFEGGDDMDENINHIGEELIPKLEAFLKKRQRQTEVKASDNDLESIANAVIRPEFILIGCSTGGPEALRTLFTNIESSVHTPILIVQHMPPVFTTELAKVLNHKVSQNVMEAQDGMKVEKNSIYIAPGDYHMEIKKQDGGAYISLNQNDKECFVRPAVNYLFRSAVQNSKGNLLACVLTGMGDDGTIGCEHIKKFGGTVLIQDEESSTVWGMPGSVFEKKYYDHILKLDDIGKLISKLG